MVRFDWKLPLAACCVLSVAAAAPAFALPPLSAADTVAAFKAAGYKPYGKSWFRCYDKDMGRLPDVLVETVDLNGDGKAEAVITETSTFCYGSTEQAFTVLSRGPNGAWKPIADEVGAYMLLKSKHNGWTDIEVGGPGMGPFPVLGFNGSKYVKVGSRRE